MDNKAFWMVWAVGGDAPTYQHPTEDSARREAQRLARLIPGKQFVVLETVASYMWDAMVKMDLRPQIEPPF